MVPNTQYRYKERKKLKALLYLFCFFVRYRYKFVILFLYFDEKRIIPHLSLVTHRPHGIALRTPLPVPQQPPAICGGSRLFIAALASCTNVSTLYT